MLTTVITSSKFKAYSGIYAGVIPGSMSETQVELSGKPLQELLHALLEVARNDMLLELSQESLH